MSTSYWKDILATFPLFAGLSEKQCQWFAERLHHKDFPAGVDIITSGAPGEKFYIILKGTAKVYIPQVDGSEVAVVILGPGDTVGEMSLLDDRSRSASVLALEETSMLWMDKEHFAEAVQTMPVLARNLLRLLSGRLRSSTVGIQTLASLDVNGRVAYQLLVFAERYGQRRADGKITIPIRLPQGELADLVGASRKRVNQAIVAFKQKESISIDETFHITILDEQALRQWSRKED